jgi:hypothetical protein
MTDEPRKIEVDIGAAMAALQASPELAEEMNRLVGGTALIEAQAEIERLRAAVNNVARENVVAIRGSSDVPAFDLCVTAEVNRILSL